MNRSILIVTCDFLVLAAMSLSIGMSEVGDPAGTAKISSPANRLVEMIDEELARHEAVKQQKDELEKRLEEFRALALRDEKQIADRDEELEQAKAKLAETLAALTESKDALSSEKTRSQQELAKSAAELDKAKKELDEREAALKRSAAVIAQKEKELDLSAKEIQERDKAIRENEAAIEKSEQALAQANKEKAETAAKLAQADKEKAETAAKLAQADREKAETAAKLAQADREKAETAAKLAQADKEKAETAAKLAQADKEKAEAVAKLEQIDNESAGAVAKLEQVTKEKAETVAKLEQVSKEKAETAARLAEADRGIIERDKVIRESEVLLEKSERSLAQVNKEKTETVEKLQQSEKTLSHTTGQLETTQHELEALREQARLDRARADEAIAKYHATEIELVETKSKLTSTQTQLDGMVRVLTDVNSDLVKTKTDLDESRQTLAVTKETLAQNEKILDEKEKQIADKQRDLAETRKEAAELKKMLNNDVLNSYNASALELSFHLVNDRLFNNITIDKSFFLPAVTLGGKNWLVSAFRDTTGLNLYSGYTKVTELQYKVRRPQSKDKWTAINGPALCLGEDSRVCLFPVEAGKAEPVRVLTFDALRERGVDNLTLFKSGTFSKDSADVTGRCSLSLEQGDNHLYIRNPNRSSSELKAEVGDIVLSKEGFFIGVVVKVSSSDLGQTSTALCYVFPGEPDFTKAIQLRLTKEPAQTLYYDFVDGHEALRKRADQLDKGK